MRPLVVLAALALALLAAPAASAKPRLLAFTKPAGFHSATATEYDWPFYGRLVGAYFKQHPAVQPATVDVTAPFARAARLPRAWTRTDEWYDFRTNPRPHVHVLATLDESTSRVGR